ncbi:unnamed protein product [Cuscuta europaea]|uniref:Uncharacterized protein n=1 Tax=Cuscuta europaea TaxID=41803 RepID=A0A9P1E5D3_CUSEU|nr:unnamed protein product [Cuscuta europaea]
MEFTRLHANNIIPWLAVMEMTAARHQNPHGKQVQSGEGKIMVFGEWNRDPNVRLQHLIDAVKRESDSAGGCASCSENGTCLHSAHDLRSLGLFCGVQMMDINSVKITVKDRKRFPSRHLRVHGAIRLYNHSYSVYSVPKYRYSAAHEK